MKSLKPRSPGRPSPEEALRVASETAPQQPPAQVRPQEPAPAPIPAPVPADATTTLNLRVRESTVEALTVVAKARGLTMKQVVAQALVAAGVEIAPADLEDRTPRRKR